MALTVQVVQCRGTPFDIGRQQAGIFLRSAKGMAFAKRRNAPLPAWFDFASQERAFTRYCPALWQEIGGLAEGLGIPMEKAAFHFGNGGWRVPLGGCSATITDKAYVRNYDFTVRHYSARFALVQPQGSYASIGGAELLTGRLDGMNEHGLCIGLHLVRRAPRVPGLLAIVLIRMVLDQCATTAEAVSLMRRTPHAMRYNFSILDAHGSAAVVEAAPGMVAVRTGPWLACTNHFQSPLMRSFNRNAGHSIGRLPPLERWAKEGLDAPALFMAFNQSTSPAFHHGYLRGAGTLHTLACEPEQRKMILGVGGDAEKLGRNRLEIDFAAWCAGKDLPVQFLSGDLGGRSKPLGWPPVRTSKKRA